MAPKLQTGNFDSLPLGGKIFLLFAGLAVLSAGYYLGVHMGVEEDTQAEQRRNNVLKNELQQARDRQKEYLKLREELAGRDALNKQNLRILPERAEIPAFLDTLNRLAELSGLSMGSVRPSPEIGEEFFIRVPVELIITGKYHQLAKFFYNVSRHERAINMENIKLTDPKIVGEDVVLKVSVRATTFRRKEEE